MTFDEIVTEIMDRLNITSTEAETRIGRIVNRYHKRACAAINVASVSKRMFDQSMTVTTGDPEVAFAAMNKITRVWYEGTGDEKIFLDERTIDELRDESVVPSGDTPSKWAQLSVASLTVTILLDMKPLTGYELFCDGYGTTGELTGDDEPAFSEDYHDLLVEGPLKDEYKKLKQLSLANDSKLEYERILGDLKFHNAKSAYLRIRQNGRPRGQRFRRDNLVN